MMCVFTGKMTSMTRHAGQQAIKNVGDIPQDKVRKDTDYLIIGNDGFRESLHNTSDKIRKAQANQLNGLPIQIISEDAFLTLLDE
jgi:DNA polymerase-3 subunit epsilon